MVDSALEWRSLVRSMRKPMSAAMKPRAAHRVMAPWKAVMNASRPAVRTWSRRGPALWATASMDPALMPWAACSAVSCPISRPAWEAVNSSTTRFWKKAPTPAMPTCWKVSLMPEATPDLAGSVTPMARAARAGLKAPIAKPAMTGLGMSTVQAESASARLRKSRPMAITRVEPPSSTRKGTLPINPPPMAPATNIAPVSGKKRRPASRSR